MGRKYLNSRHIKYIMVFLLLIGISFILTWIGASNAFPEMISVIWVTTISFVLINVLIGECKSRAELVIVMISYLIRCMLVLIDVITGGWVRDIVGASDSRGFWLRANMYYDGTLSITNTTHYYAYFLNIIMHIFGTNMFLCQYVNVVCSVLTQVIVLKVLNRYAENVKREAIIAIVCFMPYNIYYSVVLLRESIITLFLTLSFYYFLRWIYDKKTIYNVISWLTALPAIIMHTGSIVIWIAYIIFMSFYDNFEEKLHVKKKSLIIIGIAIATVIITLTIPQLKRIIWTYIPIKNMRIVEYAQYLLNRYGRGGSMYLRNMSVNSVVGVVVATILRMLHFQFSPMPWDWRGLEDIITAILDSSVHLLILVLGLYSLKKCQWKKSDRLIVILMFFIIVIMQGFFAWPTANAGTAIRHRDKFLGIEVIGLIFIIKSFKSGKKEKKSE